MSLCSLCRRESARPPAREVRCVSTTKDPRQSDQHSWPRRRLLTSRLRQLIHGLSKAGRSEEGQSSAEEGKVWPRWEEQAGMVKRTGGARVTFGVPCGKAAGGPSFQWLTI